RARRASFHSKGITMAEQLLAGAINPFALAEIALGRAINWDKVADPRGLMKDVFKIQFDHLFDASYRSVTYASARFRADGTMDRALLDLNSKSSVEAAAALKSAGIDGIAAMSADSLDRLAPHLAQAAVEGPQQEYTPPNAIWVDPGEFFEEGTEFS